MHVLQFRDRVIHKINRTCDNWLSQHTQDNNSFDIDAEPSLYLEKLSIELDREFQP